MKLGLDIGSNSIGWALVDDGAYRIVAAGVRIFPEGVEGGELSKGESRRIARGMRRQIARRARRKKLLRKALILAGLLPADPAEQQKLDALNPYELRRRALDEPLTPHELGRVLIHLNQRRGFLSNRKADRGKKNEDSKMLAEISQLQQEIESDSRTLGEHLAKQYTQDPLARIRGKHTRRQMLQAEFDAIWAAQQRHHAALLTEELKHGASGPTSFPREPEWAGSAEQALRKFGIYGLLFFQRPMYWPKSVVGQCELNPKEKRSPRADRAAQKFRIYQEVNNLRIIAGHDGEIKELQPEQREKVLALLFRKKEVTFDELRKSLKLLENDGFNLEAGERKKLKGMETDCLLAHKSLFGKAWFERDEAERDSIVRSLLDDEEDVIMARATSEWGLSTESAADVASVSLPEGYASYGRETLRRLLPFIAQGMPLMTRDETPCAVVAAGFLPPWKRARGQHAELPAPPDVTNPLVRQALYELRKVVNAVIREHGVPNAIHIELAREVKGSATQREEMTRKMRERERRRDAAAKEIESLGEKPTRSKIDMYLLWEEQGRECFYSLPARPISVHQLFGGEVNVDHVLPYSQSLDDSLMNKVLCFRSENDAKGQQTPFQWLAESNPAKYEAVLQRAARLPYEIRNRKRPRFSQKTCELTEFINRQLTDTAYITRVACDYLKALGTDVLGGKGQLTAELRHEWGLNSILREDDLSLKNREDHRHHAVDAIVIALTDRSCLQSLARGTQLPAPWATFRADAEAAINAIRVSHRVRRKVAGALHEETIYGPTPHAGVFVYRKPLSQLTPAMLEDIRDPAIRKLVVARLAAFDIAPGDKKKIHAEAWKQPLRMKSGVEIKKVRLLKQDETIRPIRGGVQCVKPGSNHHVCIFELPDGKGGTKREPIFVSMLEAARRMTNHEEIIQRVHPTRSDARFIMSLSRGEMVLATFKGQERLVWYRTGASTQGQLYFVDHRDARQDKDAERYVAKASTLNGRKVTVDQLGRVRWAND